MRRTVVGGTVAAVMVVGLMSPAQAEPDEPDSLELTLLGTTDTHGHVYDWDYFEDSAYADEEDVLGLTRVSSYVNEVRDEVGDESVLLMDSGDAIQGTPLTYYYGLGPGADEVLDEDREHPMAQAFNYMDYDTLGVGNHEFNYGLDMLEAYERDLDGPQLLGANVLDADTGEPWLQPYEVVEREIDGETVKVGILGLVTPGVRIWDKKFVDGVLEFQDLVAAAQEWVPKIQEEADIVVVNAHSGKGDVDDDGYDQDALYENVINNVAYQVPGIDYILFGHSHQDDPETVITNKDGDPVLLTQPYYWARSVTRTTMNLVPDDDGWQVDWSEGNAPHAEATYGHEISEEDPDLQELLQEEHETTVDYVNTPVATSVTELSAETSRYEDTPIIDFINHIQLETLDDEIGDEVGDATIVSQASPFSRTAVFPEGDVTIRDIASLYIYENTLRGVELTGAQLRDYLEYSALFFNQVEEGEDFDPEMGTNAETENYPDGVPDYAYDVLAGVDYYIDISQDPGERIAELTYPDGSSVSDDDVFIMALNNYRSTGGAGYPHVADAPVVFDGQEEIRQSLIDWSLEHEVIDPDDFFVENWQLITEPLADPSPEPTEEPTSEPTVEPTAEPTPEPTSPEQPPGDGSLPETGAAVGTVSTMVALLLGAGIALVLIRRRGHAG